MVARLAGLLPVRLVDVSSPNVVSLMRWYALRDQILCATGDGIGGIAGDLAGGGLLPLGQGLDPGPQQRLVSSCLTSTSR